MRPAFLHRRRIFSARGVDWYVDDSILLLAVFAIIIVVTRYWAGIGALFAYVTLLLGHEAGHALFARLRGYTVTGVTLGGFFGLVECYDATGRNHLRDWRFIASGGVAAQLVILVASVGISLIPGIQRAALVYAVSLVLVFINGLLVVLNLLPFRGLDGSIIWSRAKTPGVSSHTPRRRKRHLRVVK